MVKRQLRVLAFYAFLLFAGFSCSSEQTEGGEGSGTLHVQVSTNPDVVGVNTRVDGGATEDLPDVNDFSFSIFKGEALRSEWNTFAEFLADRELTLRAGSDYVAKASYGDVSEEGFGLPYYEGSSPFSITRGKTTEVEVTCSLANAKLAIVYTDAFKDYFATYSSEVTTSLGSVVKYESSEERYAYFKPGNLQVDVKVRKKEGYSQEVTLNAKNFVAEARHAYLLTLDVDAGTPSIQISFSDDIPNQEPVTIVVSDEALSAPAPYFTANGFDANQAMIVVEGKRAEASEVYAYLHAEAGISRCVLTTRSATLIEQGWPESVELTDPTDEQLAAMKKLGLSFAGLGAQKDKIAKIDFTDVIPYLEYTGEDAEHVFTLTATDKYSKESSVPMLFRVHSADSHFAITGDESVLYGTTKMKARLTLDGDVDKVTYWLKSGEEERQIHPSVVTATDDNHAYDVIFKFAENQTISPQIEARFLRRTETIAPVMGDPVLLQLQYEGDVWTKCATLQLSGTPTDWEFQERTKDASGSYGTWNELAYQIDGSLIELTGLTPATEYAYRFVKVDEEGDVIGESNRLEIETEEEKQIPNSGFEEWYSEKLYSTIGSIYTFYPFAEASGVENRWWDTSNKKTTPNPGGAAAWYYRSYPGVVPTSGGEYTATYHLNKYDGKKLATGGRNGGIAAEIATVGWGTGNTWSIFSKNTSNRTAGNLYIGTYGEAEEYGKPFASRPTKLTFWYRYYSYNNESTEPIVEVYAEDGSRIGLGKKTISGSVDEFKEENIDIDYAGNEGKKAAWISVIFSSTNSGSPQTKAIGGGQGAFAGYWDSRHIGSVLTIDDVSLVYDK